MARLRAMNVTFFRVSGGETSYIVMDAPPPVEDCSKFMRISRWLRAMSLNCPEVLQADTRHGFLLITDLGRLTYLEALQRDDSIGDELYADAMRALQRLQHEGTRYQSKLPPYDEKLLRFELSIFREWLCEKHLGLHFSGDDERAWNRCCDILTESALVQPRVFVHRDYHSRNLMVVPGDNPGILDFQDALEGPLTYDLVSLLKDCYRRLPDGDVASMTKVYYESLPSELARGLSAQRLKRFFDLMGTQRHLKAAGIFARLLRRDGKPGYLPDIPRTLSYVSNLAQEYPELDFVTSLVKDRVLPMLEETRPRER